MCSTIKKKQQLSQTTNVHFHNGDAFDSESTQCLSPVISEGREVMREVDNYLMDKYKFHQRREI
jgi:hypothetical protein